MFGSHREVKVDIEHTIYSDLGIPEDEEGIVNAIKEVRRKLYEGPNYRKGPKPEEDVYIYDESGATLYSRVKLLAQVDNALETYKETGSLTELLNKYVFTDIAIYRNIRKDALKRKYKQIEADKKAVNKDYVELRDDEIARIVASELNEDVKRRFDYWGVLYSPESKREYDEELSALRKIQAIEDEKIKARVLRNKLAKEELRRRYGRQSFDRSDLGGDKIPPYKHGSPTYGWSIREYPRGKQLIFSTNTSFAEHPELDEKVEVYAHGAFEWGTMYRQNADRASFSPTYLDGLCEVISVRKVDKNGNETVAYGIAQTRDLGYFASLTEAEIREKEARGIKVMLTSTPEEIEEQEFLRRREERIARRRQQREAIRRANKPKTLEDRLLGVKKFLYKIGLEGIDISEKEETSDYIPQATDAIQTFVPRQLQDPNRKYNVFVLSPVRYRLSEAEKANLAKTHLAEFMLVQAKEKNGHCFGSLSEAEDGASIRVLDETIRACQFASVNPGVFVSGIEPVRSVRVNSLENALTYLQQKDNARTAKREAIVKRRNEVIDFLGE